MGLLTKADTETRGRIRWFVAGARWYVASTGRHLLVWRGRFRVRQRFSGRNWELRWLRRGERRWPVYALYLRLTGAPCRGTFSGGARLIDVNINAHWHLHCWTGRFVCCAGGRSSCRLFSLQSPFCLAIWLHFGGSHSVLAHYGMIRLAGAGWWCAQCFVDLDELRVHHCHRSLDWGGLARRRWYDNGRQLLRTGHIFADKKCFGSVLCGSRH